MVLALLINAVARGYKNVPANFPSMSTNSAAISAMCCPPKEDTEAHLFEVRLGIVKDAGYGSGMDLGRLTLSTCISIEKPEEGMIYLQPVEVPKKPFGMEGKLKLTKMVNNLGARIHGILGHIRRRRG